VSGFSVQARGIPTLRAGGPLGRNGLKAELHTMECMQRPFVVRPSGRKHLPMKPEHETSFGNKGFVITDTGGSMWLE